MLKIILHIAFTIVAGEGQPQDNGQNQVLFSPPPLQAFRNAQGFSPAVAAHSIQSPHARPCRRRNNVDSPNSGWVQVPLPYNQPVAQQLVSPTGHQPIPSQLKPQSLTESLAPPVFDENNEEERTGSIPEFPDEIVESVEQKSFPKPNSQNRNSDADENSRSGRDPNNNNNGLKSNPNQNYLAYWQPNTGSQDTTNDRKDLPDCEGIEELNQELKSANPENNSEADSKNSPSQVQEQAIKILSKCVQEARNPDDDFVGEPRRSMSSSLTSSPQANNAKSLPSEKVESNPESAQDEDRSAQPYLQNPAKNAAKWGPDSQISLLQHGRVCYACSSYFDHSCWHPNATTTIKYCNKDNNACLTKTFKVGGNSILIRDCGHTCNDPDPYGVNPKVKSCSICHTDMCNSAYSIHGFSALLALVTAAVKYL